MRAWIGALIGALLILTGSVLAWRVQTSGGEVAVSDVRFPGGPDLTLSGLLYVPKTATPEHPAPAVLVSHGFINTREMQSPFAIELSRRGYVVLAMDMTGHGYSGGVLAQAGFGGPAALKYLAAQPFVDKTRIGMEGHSMGGGPVLSAAQAMPDAYKAIVLEGSSPVMAAFGRGGGGGARRGAGAPGAAPPPAPFKPRNLEVVFGQYDEFAQTMWGVPKGADVPTSPRLQAMFGTKDPVKPGQLYGSLADGSGRMLVLPAVDHPQEHFTRAGVAPALTWLGQTLGQPKPLDANNQVWLWKEIGTLIGFVGCVVLILGVFNGLSSLGIFAVLNEPGRGAHTERSPMWLLGVVLTAAIPAALYFPMMENGQKWFMAGFNAVGQQNFALATFPQQVNNQLAVWALASGALAFLLSAGNRGGTITNRWAAAILATLLSVAIGYLALVAVDTVFHVDFRFWVLGLKPLDAPHAVLFITYLPFFLVFFMLSARAYAVSLPVRGEGYLPAIVTGAVASALGFMIMLGIQYYGMKTNGLLTHNQPLLTIVAFQFVPLLMVIGAVMAFTYRRTNGWASGALICALFITWYVVPGTVIYPATPPRPVAPTTNSPAVTAPAPKAPISKEGAAKAP